MLFYASQQPRWNAAHLGRDEGADLTNTPVIEVVQSGFGGGGTLGSVGTIGANHDGVGEAV